MENAQSIIARKKIVVGKKIYIKILCVVFLIDSKRKRICSPKSTEKFWVQTEKQTHDPPRFRADALITELMEL